MTELSTSVAPPTPPKADDPAPSSLPRPFLFLLLASLFLVWQVVWPLRLPIFLAIGAAVTCRPVHFLLVPRLGNRPRLAGLLLTVCFLVGILVPVGIGCVAIAHEVEAGLRWTSETLGMPAPQPADLPAGFERVLVKLSESFHVSTEEVRSFASRLAQGLQDTVPVVLGMSLGLFGGTFLLLIGFYFFVVDGHLLTRFLLKALPLRPKQTHDLIEEFRNTCSGALLSNACNCLAQACVMGLGFVVAGVPHALFFASLAVFAALVPLIGSFLVWVPAVSILAAREQYAWAVGLGVWCLVMVAVVDNTVKPLVLRGKLDLHGGLLLIGFVGGAAAFGPVGLLVGPIIMAFAVALLRIYQRDYLVR